MARECNSAFEWAAHEPEALQVGVPAEVIKSIKFRKPTATMEAPFGTVVGIRQVRDGSLISVFFRL
jgi:hypothetical protein